ncbi:MAG: GGDEF domain-containing protein [Coriobacteriales bacterium]|nr:GGDEF domain-containing protein [Coriobacteriales bacterium]
MRQIVVAMHGEAASERELAQVREAWESGTYGQLLFHVYSGDASKASTVQVARDLQTQFPQAHVVGTMSAGEIACGRLVPRGVLVSALLFEDTNVQVLRYDDVLDREAFVGKQIRRDVEAVDHVKAVELLFPGTEVYTKGLFEQLSLCDTSIQFFGGYSGGHELNAPARFVFDPSGIMRNSILVTVFSGPNLHVDIDKVIGWEPLGLPFTVTKAHGNRLIELDGRPASEVYEKFLQIDRTQTDNAEEGYTFPFLAQYKGEAWLRSAIHIGEDGSLDLHGYVTEGMEIQLSYGNTESIVRQINQRVEALRQFKPQAILLYSCIVRKVFWEDFVDIEMEPFAQLCSTAGFHTWGEIQRNPHTHEVVEHNVTLLSIALREGNPPIQELAPVRVNDTVLKGPAAQMRRLTSLVYTAMGELQKTHSELRDLNRRLTIMAERDALTGLYNRGKTEALIEQMLDESAITRQPVSLLMLDIDHFKRVNDVYGHHTGDEVLREVATRLGSVAATWVGAEAGRWGGEEFFLVLPNAREPEAMLVAEDLRKAIEQQPFPQAGRVTTSIGVITVTGNDDRIKAFANVDDALYRAKEGGRNRAVQATLA